MSSTPDPDLLVLDEVMPRCDVSSAPPAAALAALTELTGREIRFLGPRRKCTWRLPCRGPSDVAGLQKLQNRCQRRRMTSDDAPRENSTSRRSQAEQSARLTPRPTGKW